MAEVSPEGVEFTQHEGFLEARLFGAFTFERHKRQIEIVAQACKDRKQTLLLWNTLGLVGTLTTVERYEVGVLAATLAAGSLRAAVLGKPPVIDPGTLGSVVAGNRGLVNAVFTDRSRAIEWLRSSPEGLPSPGKESGWAATLREPSPPFPPGSQ